MFRTRLATTLRLGSLLAFLLLSPPGTGAPLPPASSPGSTAVAQDSTGTVWALPEENGSNSTEGTLRDWSVDAQKTPGTKWATQTIPGAAGYRPQVLTRGDNGAVYAFWQKSTGKPNETPQCLVTVHRGAQSQILARFSASLIRNPGYAGKPHLFAGPKGDVWLCGFLPQVWHLAPGGSVRSYPLTPEQFYDGHVPQELFFSPFSSVTGGDGRRWFWQSGLADKWPTLGLRGVLIWDGKALAYHSSLTGVPNRHFSVLAPLDATHLWLATSGRDPKFSPLATGALYRLDTRTLSAVAEPLPQPEAFGSIVQIFRANGDWYIAEQQEFKLRLVVWRKQAEQKQARQWRKALDRTEEIGRPYEMMELLRPWAAEPSGVWLGASGGAWWLPRGKASSTNKEAALWVDWHRGLASLQMQGLFPTADGSLLVIGEPGEARMAAVPQPLRPVPPGLVAGGFGAPKIFGPLLADPRHHLWESLTTYSGSFPHYELYEWDGTRWRAHQAPKSITDISGLYACDTQGRLWLSTTHWTPPAQPQPVEGRVVYDPAHDTWTDYPTVQDALAAAAALPGMAFLPSRSLYLPPSFSGDGRVAYTYNTTLFFFDGHAWQQWDAQKILPGYYYGNFPERPHFGASGSLQIALIDHLWEWTAAGGWQQRGLWSPPPYENSVRLSGVWMTGIDDDIGGTWFHWKGEIYTARAGLWVKQTEISGPGSPFQYGYTLDSVLHDPAGRVFFVCRPLSGYELITWSLPPVPKPTLSVAPVADDAVTVRVQTMLTGPHWVRWRVNGGAWHEPQMTKTIPFTGMPQGSYRVEVESLDRRLQLSPAPAAAVFQIEVLPAVQIARWLRALRHGTDSERDAAVAGLVKQPRLALPALQAARTGASRLSSDTNLEIGDSDMGPSDSEQWWLNAAIQQVEQAGEEAP